jgi:hypothetical protein
VIECGSRNEGKTARKIFQYKKLTEQWKKTIGTNKKAQKALLNLCCVL